MRYLLTFILLALTTQAIAEGVSVPSTCKLTWTAPRGPVDGYKVYVGATPTTKTLRVTVKSTYSSCSTFKRLVGQNYASVVAFNAGGESDHSETLPFVVVITAPLAPTSVNIQ